MKKQFNASQKFLAIKKVLEKYPAEFENKPEATLARDTFIAEATALAGRINELIRPVSTMLVYRRLQREEIYKQMYALLNMSMLLARRKPDPAMEALMTSYNRRLHSVSGPMLIEIGQDVLSVINQNSELADELGLSTEARQSLSQQIADFQSIIDSTDDTLDARRSSRTEIDAMIKNCYDMLRTNLDRFVKYYRHTNPVFYNSYMRLRRKSGKNHSYALPTDSDISGQVTSSATGLPIDGATINLIEHGFVLNTLADGQFLLDELEPGSYTVSCHANGFEVPPQATFELSANDSVVHNFVLTPVTV
jgi:hypothetical protein